MTSSEPITGHSDTVVEMMKERVHGYREWILVDGEQSEKDLMVAMSEDEHVRRALQDIPPNVNAEALAVYREYLPWARLDYRPDPQNSALLVPDAALTGDAAIFAMIDDKPHVLMVPRKDVLVNSDERPMVEGLTAGFVDSAHTAACIAEYTPQHRPAGPVRPEIPAETALREGGEEAFGGDAEKINGMLTIAGGDGRGKSAMNTLVFSGMYDRLGRDPRTRKLGNDYYGTRVRSRAYIAVLTADRTAAFQAGLRRGAGTDGAPHFVPVEGVLSGATPTWSDTRQLVADGLPVVLRTVEAERDARDPATAGTARAGDVTWSELDATHAAFSVLESAARQVSIVEARLGGVHSVAFPELSSADGPERAQLGD